MRQRYFSGRLQSFNSIEDQLVARVLAVFKPVLSFNSIEDQHALRDDWPLSMPLSPFNSIEDQLIWQITGSMTGIT